MVNISKPDWVTNLLKKKKKKKKTQTNGQNGRRVGLSCDSILNQDVVGIPPTRRWGEKVIPLWKKGEEYSIKSDTCL